MARLFSRVFVTAAALVLLLALLPVTVSENVYAESGVRLDHFTFEGDESQWGHRYIIDETEGAIPIGDLDISVFDENDDEVDPDKYDLWIEHLWYDEEQDREVGDPVDMSEPLGLADADRHTESDPDGRGYTEYRVIAEPKEESGYSEMIEANFYVVHQYTLSWMFQELDFPGKIWKGGWRMRDWYKVTLDKLSHPVVRDVKGRELTKGVDYDVTYCKRVPVEGEYGTDYDHGEPTGNGGADLPSEAGEYFVRSAAIGSEYYGEYEVLLDIGNYIGINRREDEPEELWSDRDKNYDIAVPEGLSSDDVQIETGIMSEDGEWEVLLENDGSRDFYDLDPGKTVLTLHGRDICEEVGDGSSITIHAFIPGEDDEPLAEAYEDVMVNEARYDYDLPYEDRLLRYWDARVYEEIHANIRNADFPDGRDFFLHVEEVEIVDQDPEEGFDKVLEDPVLKDDEGEDNKYYSMDAAGNGSAVVSVTYTDHDGIEKEHRYTVYVSDVIYEADVWSESGKFKALPGDTLDLTAWANKKYRDDEDNEQETDEGLRVHWEITEGEQFAELESAGDGYHAAITFKEVEHGEYVSLRIWVTDADSGDPDKELASSDMFFIVANEIHQLEPALIDRDLDVGDTVAIDPKMMVYRVGQEPEEIENVRFRIDSYSDEISVEEPGEGETEFRVTRNVDWDFDFRLAAEWNEGSELLEAFNWYHMDWRDYGIEFCRENDCGEDTNSVYSDGDLRFSIDTRGIDIDKEDGEGNKVYDVQYKVGIGDHDDEAGDIDWQDEPEFIEGTHYIIDGNDIVLKGAALYELLKNDDEEGSIDAEGRVQVKISKNGLVLASADEWFEVKKADIRRDRQDEHIDMLIGWVNSIDEGANVHVENTEYPDGRDFEYTVTDVEVAEQNTGEDAADGEDVVTVEKMEDDEYTWWDLRAENYGDARITVTYKDPEELGGGAGSYDFRVHVGHDVYRVDLDSENGIYNALPGQPLTLVAYGVHDSDQDIPEDEFRYEWGFVHGEDAAALEPDGNKAVVTFSEKPDDWDGWYWRDARVWVRLYVGDEERAYNDIWMDVSESLDILTPAKIRSDLDVDEKETVTFEVRQYPADNEDGYTVLSGVRFRWAYDPRAVSIKDKNGKEQNGLDDDKLTTGDSGEFTITKLKNWETSIFLTAEWDDENGDHQDRSTEYRLDETCEEHEWSITVTKEPTCTETGLQDMKCEVCGKEKKDVEIEKLSHVAAKTDAIAPTCTEAGRSAYWQCSSCGKYFSDEACLNEIAEGSWVVPAAGHDYQDVPGTAKAATCTEAGREADKKCSRCGDVVTGAEIPAAGHDYQTVEGTAKAATCTEVGKEADKKCSRCGDVVTGAATAKLPHTLKEVALKKATDKKTGNIAYWTCEVCHHCFSDEEGKTEIDVAETVIPKNTFKVTLKKKLYTAKANKKTVLKAKNLFKVSAKKGKVTYKKSKGDKKIKISSSGNITVAKGLKKKTYSVKVKVTTAANAQYAACTRTITVKIKVK